MENDVQNLPTCKIDTNKKALAIAVLIVIILLSAIFLKIANKGVDFEKTFPQVSDEYWCKIGKDGSYMEIDAFEYNYDVRQVVKDVNSKLGFSESLSARMEQTRPIDGTQTAENRKIRVSWTFDGKELKVLYENK